MNMAVSIDKNHIFYHIKRKHTGAGRVAACASKTLGNKERQLHLSFVHKGCAITNLLRTRRFRLEEDDTLAVVDDEGPRRTVVSRPHKQLGPTRLGDGC